MKHTNSDFQESFYLEVKYLSETETVLIIANTQALKHLQDLFQNLIESETPGSHHHLERSSGLDGNVNSLILEKKEP